MDVRANLVGIGNPSLTGFGDVGAQAVNCTSLNAGVGAVTGGTATFSLFTDFISTASELDITTQLNNYSATFYTRINCSTGSPAISGIGGGALGQANYRMFYNAGTIGFVFLHQSSSSSASNRLILPGNTLLVLFPGEGCIFVYDSTVDRWVLASKHTINAYSPNNLPPVDYSAIALQSMRF